MERLAKEVKEREGKIKELKSLTQKVRRENARLEREIEQKEEEIERERKLSDARSRAEILSAESNYNSKLEDERSKFEAERRKLFAFAADGFREYFNPQEAIDERSFKSLMGKVQTEMKRLAQQDQSIRRMVGATGRQGTEEAVAQILMNRE